MRPDAVVAAGALPAIIKALTTHPANALLCTPACTAIQNMATGSGPQQEARAAACVAAGAADALVKVLDRHKGTVAVCSPAATALQGVTSGAAGAARDARVEACVKAGAVAVLVDALREHVASPGRGGSTGAICGSLLNLAWTSEAQRGKIVAEGAVHHLSAVALDLNALDSDRVAAKAVLDKLGFSVQGGRL